MSIISSSSISTSSRVAVVALCVFLKWENHLSAYNNLVSFGSFQIQPCWLSGEARLSWILISILCPQGSDLFSYQQGFTMEVSSFYPLWPLRSFRLDLFLICIFKRQILLDLFLLQKRTSSCSYSQKNVLFDWWLDFYSYSYGGGSVSFADQENIYYIWGTTSEKCECGSEHLKSSWKV